MPALQRAAAQGGGRVKGSEDVAHRGRRIGRDVVEFKGHPMVRSTHPTTIEVTTEEYLTEQGDCIIGVGADKGCGQLDAEVREMLRKEGSKVKVSIFAGGLSFVIHARGNPRLELTHLHDIVVRKSEFISDRTLAVGADASSLDIPRGIVRALRSPAARGRMEIEVS